MDAVIVIIGGMGPMAGAECFKYIASNSKTNGTDQSNLDVMLVSFPSRIVNRVDFVLGRTDINPASCVLEFMKPQFQALSASYKRIIVGVPCITFHCPCCFSVFQDEVRSLFPTVEIVSIVTSTVSFVDRYFPEVRRIGIMSTDGTRHAKPFKQEFGAHNIEIVYLTDDQQCVVTDCIYNVHWLSFLRRFTGRGMKSLTFNHVHAHSLLCVVMDQLLQEGCDAILLGCTEIPLAIPETEYKGVPVLNASWMMAHELVRRADPRKLKPFK